MTSRAPLRPILTDVCGSETVSLASHGAPVTPARLDLSCDDVVRCASSPKETRPRTLGCCRSYSQSDLHALRSPKVGDANCAPAADCSRQKREARDSDLRPALGPQVGALAPSLWHSSGCVATQRSVPSAHLALHSHFCCSHSHSEATPPFCLHRRRRPSGAMRTTTPTR